MIYLVQMLQKYKQVQLEHNQTMVLFFFFKQNKIMKDFWPEYPLIFFILSDFSKNQQFFKKRFFTGNLVKTGLFGPLSIWQKNK